MKSSREQFEEWYKKSMIHRVAWYTEGNIKSDLTRDIDGEYMRTAVSSKWQSWQASRAAIEIELPSKEDPANFFCEIYDCDLVHESLANCGLKVKS